MKMVIHLSWLLPRKAMLMAANCCCKEVLIVGLSMVGKSNKSKVAEGVIFDHLARTHVLLGEELCNRTQEGRSSPHVKVVRMLKSGLLTWGKSRRLWQGQVQDFLRIGRKVLGIKTG
uniref:Putative ankyrin-2-like isoform X2 n=1 Tax=Davidia involucrata TaxID=16924 RepID=A0A5B7BEI8_DAVIN